jgi:hypothetical protein
MKSKRKIKKRLKGLYINDKMFNDAIDHHLHEKDIKKAVKALNINNARIEELEYVLGIKK